MRNESWKVYVKQSYLEKTPVKHVKQLPYDIDGRAIFNIPFNPESALNPRGMVDLDQT